MRIFFYFLAFLLFFSCKTAHIQTKTPERISTNKSYETMEINGDSLVAAFSKELKEYGDEYSKEHRKYRDGEWTEFYENGNKKESGNYKLDTYIQCCAIGFCESYYSYKVGEWSYYYENGLLKATGVYRIGEKNIATSCEGGDTIKFGFVTKHWNFYDNKGEKIKPSKMDIAEIEKSSVIDEWDMRN